jgi:hypothetical protein
MRSECEDLPVYTPNAVLWYVDSWRGGQSVILFGLVNTSST